MSVQVQYIRDDVDAEKSPTHREVCFGFLLENEPIVMEKKVGGRVWFNFDHNKPVTAVRVFSPAMKNGRTIPFTEQEMNLMKALKEASPEVFEPVSFGEDYLEISTDCPADQFWFCLNGMRILYDPYFNSYRFFETLTPIIGLWKTFFDCGRVLFLPSIQCEDSIGFTGFLHNLDLCMGSYGNQSGVFSDSVCKPYGPAPSDG